MSATGSIRMLYAGRTDVGLVREHNEDNLLVVDLDAAETVVSISALTEETLELELGHRGALLLVCDGMGGAAAGEVASQMAVETVAEAMIGSTSPTADVDETARNRVGIARRMKTAALGANARIHHASQTDEGRAGMGTTMTGVGVTATDLVMAQVGDSRAYILRAGVLTQVTRDQSLVNQLLELGQITEEQAKMFEHSNVILQALGVQEEVEVLLSTVPLRRGDRVVLCSDGLTGVVTDEEVAAILGGTDDMNEVCRLLIEMARGGGGPDNITVVAARFEGEGLPLPTEDDKIAYRRWPLDEGAQGITAGGAGQQREAGDDDGYSASPSLVIRRRDDPARTFLSLMVMLALTLGGLVAASQMHHTGAAVPCLLSASPGLSVRVDGRDVGVRTRDGELRLRLPPGKHRVGLRGQGAPAEEQAVDVKEGTACRLSFNAAP